MFQIQGELQQQYQKLLLETNNYNYTDNYNSQTSFFFPPIL